MLKREVTYIDFNDQTQKETFYFNLSKAEWLEIVVDDQTGLDTVMKGMIAAGDAGGVLRQVKELALAAYGKKSDDGKNFFKVDPTTGIPYRIAFEQSAAFQEFFVEISSSEDAFTEFFVGLVPKDMQDQVNAETVRSKTGEVLQAIKEGRPLPDLSVSPSDVPAIDTSVVPPPTT